MLEVVVALLIASAGFGVVMTTLVQAKRAGARSAAADRELAVARTLIEEAFVNALPADQSRAEGPGVRVWSGTTDGVPWTVTLRSVVAPGMEIERHAELGQAPPPTQALPRLVQLDLVTAQAGRVTLTTSRW